MFFGMATITCFFLSDMKGKYNKNFDVIKSIIQAFNALKRLKVVYEGWILSALKDWFFHNIALFILFPPYKLKLINVNSILMYNKRIDQMNNKL